MTGYDWLLFGMALLFPAALLWRVGQLVWQARAAVALAISAPRAAMKRAGEVIASSDLVTSFRALTGDQRKQALAILTGIVCLGFLFDGRSQAHHWEVLGQLLSLPDDVEHTRFKRSTRSTAALPSGEGIVTFTPRQLADFIGTIDDPARWKPAPATHNGVEVEWYSAEARRWTPLPPPLYVGHHRIGWGNLSREAVAGVRNGRVFCLALQTRPTSRNPDAFPESDYRYVAKACGELSRTERVNVIVKGVLDTQARKLHIRVN